MYGVLEKFSTYKKKPRISPKELAKNVIGTYDDCDRIKAHIGEFKPASPWNNVYDVRVIITEGDTDGEWPVDVLSPWKWYQTKETNKGTVVDIDGVEIPLRYFGFRKICDEWHNGTEMEHLDHLFTAWKQYLIAHSNLLYANLYGRMTHEQVLAEREMLRAFYKVAVKNYKWLDSHGRQDTANIFICGAVNSFRSR